MSKVATPEKMEKLRKKKELNSKTPKNQRGKNQLKNYSEIKKIYK